MTTNIRPILLNWSESIDLGVTGYNIYLVSGANQQQSITLLAFVSGITTTSYTYNGVEGEQYQFEVRATTGIVESLPLEIFYPNGSSLFTPVCLTPTGQPMMTSRDMPYLTKDDFINFPNGLNLKTTSPLYTSGILDEVLQMASEEVNRYCHRHFNVQTVDEVYDGIRIGQDAPKLMTVQLNEGPIQSVQRVDVQVLKWFINFSLDYLQIAPEKGYIQIVPFLGSGLSGVPLPSAALVEGLLGKVWVRYTYGYDVIPFAIKMATSIFATKFIGLQTNPVGASDIQLGHYKTTWSKDNDPLMIQAYNLLNPYKLMTFRRP